MAASTEGFPFGPYMALPIAQHDATAGTWRAAVAISGPGAGGPGVPDRCDFPQTFESEAAAMEFATAQCELYASRAGGGAGR